MSWLEHLEAWILIVAPIAGAIALYLDFTPTNSLLYLILLLGWKIGNNALD